MPDNKQDGFTLIEVVLVLAISGALLGIAFVGQAQIRARAEFDAAINKVVASIADARNQANSAVNLQGNGNGGGGCAGGNPNKLDVFAGTAWTADSSGGVDAKLTIDYFKAETNVITAPTPDFTNTDLDGVACRYDSISVGLPWQFKASNGAQPGGHVLFTRNSAGGLAACQLTTVAGYPGTANPYFGGASACVAPGPLVLTFKDSSGQSAQVSIDASGLAKRLN